MRDPLRLDADVIVVGSGPGGATLTRELTKRGRRVLLLERGADHRPRPWYGTYLGAVLYTEHVYSFEIADVILLLAIVAAITLTMRKRPGLKQQNISEQVAVRAKDRVRIVKMDSEKREGQR